MTIPPPMTFEQQLHSDIERLRSHSDSSVEVLITRWGEAANDWVSWDVDLMVPPEAMDADAVQLYAQLGELLNHDPYRILEEWATLNRIGYMVGSSAAALLSPEPQANRATSQSIGGKTPLRP